MDISHTDHGNPEEHDPRQGAHEELPSSTRENPVNKRDESAVPSETQGCQPKRRPSTSGDWYHALC